MTSYNIQWEGKCSIIDNDRSKMNTPPPISKSTKPSINSYLECLAREEGVEQIYFLLVQCATEFCPIPKNLGDIIRLPADIQKKWLKSKLKVMNFTYFHFLSHLYFSFIFLELRIRV